MAEQRTPGTLDGSRGNRDVRDGTLQLRPGMTPGVIGGPVPGNTGLWDTLVKGAERINAVSDAIQVGRQRAGAAILKETGHALEEVVKGLIPGLLLMLVTVVGTTVIGGAIGAAVGFLAGGVGAAPGAVVGADLGFSIGMSILTWMGLAFLAEGIAKGFGEMVGAISVGTTLAWDSPDSPNPRAEIDKAGAEYAHAIALLFKFILMAIVLRLAGPASEALIAQLRKSRLGEGFASWVVRNKEALLKNPKLQAPRPKAVQSEKPVETAVTPAQLKKGAAPKASTGKTQATRPVGGNQLNAASASNAEPGAINLMKNDDPFFVNASKRKDVDPDGFLDIIAHGNETHIEVQTSSGPVLMDAKQAAQHISNLDGWNGQNIRLLSCSTGCSIDGFAAQLRSELGVSVVRAPSDILWADNSGNLFVSAGRNVVDPVTGATQFVPSWPPTGTFVDFTGGPK